MKTISHTQLQLDTKPPSTIYTTIMSKSGMHSYFVTKYGQQVGDEKFAYWQKKIDATSKRLRGVNDTIDQRKKLKSSRLINTSEVKRIMMLKKR